MNIENGILEYVKTHKVRFLNLIKKNKECAARFLEIPFHFNGVHTNKITFDNEENRFTKITYNVGVGQGIAIDDKSGLFSEVERKEIDLTNIDF